MCIDSIHIMSLIHPDYNVMRHIQIKTLVQKYSSTMACVKSA